MAVRQLVLGRQSDGTGRDSRSGSKTFGDAFLNVSAGEPRQSATIRMSAKDFGGDVKISDDNEKRSRGIRSVRPRRRRPNRDDGTPQLCRGIEADHRAGFA